jgi:hypothetical protein
MQFRLKLLLCCVAVASPLTAAAQKPAADAGPASPGAAAPPIKYESAFTGYAAHRDEKVAPWREVNDEVARVGGHIGIMRGIAAGTAPQGKPGEKR